MILLDYDGALKELAENRLHHSRRIDGASYHYKLHPVFSGYDIGAE
jgi:hypothetical protein